MLLQADAVLTGPTRVQWNPWVTLLSIVSLVTVAMVYCGVWFGLLYVCCFLLAWEYVWMSVWFIELLLPSET